MKNSPVRWVEVADDDEEKLYIDNEKKYTKYMYILPYTQTYTDAYYTKNKYITKIKGKNEIDAIQQALTSMES